MRIYTSFMTLRELRKSKNLSANMVAVAARVCPQRVRMIERGECVPLRLEGQEKYALAYGVTLSRWRKLVGLE